MIYPGFALAVRHSRLPAVMVTKQVVPGIVSIVRERLHTVSVKCLGAPEGPLRAAAAITSSKPVPTTGQPITIAGGPRLD